MAIPTTILRESFSQFLGGVNLSLSRDSLTGSEVRFAKNARPGRLGDIRKRTGTQRIHSTAVGGGVDISLMSFFSSPFGRQVVALGDGDFFYRNETETEFTRVVVDIPSDFEDFAVSRSFTPWLAGQPVSVDPFLYVLVNGNLYRWNGSELQSVTTPVSFKRIAVYNSRLFAIGGDNRLYWSALSNPENWLIDAGSGSGIVDTYDADPLEEIVVVGSSLLVMKPNSIARFTGYDIQDIQIDTETTGVTSEVGCVAPNTVCRVEDVVFFLSDRGPYLATESGIRYIGVEIQDYLNGINVEHIRKAWAEHNRPKREIWLSVPIGDSDQPNRVWKYNYVLNSWWGPDEFAFLPTSGARIENPDGSEGLVLSCPNGWIRLADVETYGARDDINLDGTGGIPITMEVRLPALDFGFQGRKKISYLNQAMEANLGDDGQMVVRWAYNGGTRQLSIFSKGPGIRTYIFRPTLRGDEILLSFSESSDEIVDVSRIELKAKLGRELFR